MELEGIINSFLPVVTGTGNRGNWSKQEVIIELPTEFNKKVCVAFWGEKINDVTSCKIGDKVKIGINIESREYNGRWYTEVRAWKVEKPQNIASENNFPESQPLTNISNDSMVGDVEDDLPF